MVKKGAKGSIKVVDELSLEELADLFGFEYFYFDYLRDDFVKEVISESLSDDEKRRPIAFLSGKYVDLAKEVTENKLNILKHVEF